MKKSVKRVISMFLLVVVLMTSAAPMSVQAAIVPAYPLPKLTGNMVEDLLNVAMSQKGYTEQPETIYGKWWTEQNGYYDYTTEPWCAMFVTWCAAHAGISNSVVYRSAATKSMWQHYKQKGQVFTTSSVIPKPGDLIFYGKSDGSTNHVAIVIKFNEDKDTVTIIGGNQGSKGEVTVRDQVWFPGTKVSDGRIILGYARPKYSVSDVIPSVPTPTPTPEPGLDGFVDVQETDWYYESVLYAKENGIMSGLTELTFGPNDDLSRAQAAAIIYRLMGTPDVQYVQQFSDVKESDWYAKAVTWASQAGVVSGYGNGKFGAEDDVTREQLAAMMYRYVNYHALDTTPKMADISGFNDADKVSGYAMDAMCWAVGYGLISGTTTTTLSPSGNTSRAQCAAIAQRFLAAYPTCM